TGTPLLRSAARDRRISAPPTGIVGIGGTTGIAELVVLAVGVVDGRGVRGSSGVRGEWHAPGVPPLGTGRTFRALFGRGDPTLRRLDRASRALVFAAEAAGIADLVPRDARDGTALVLQTALGCLDADLRFAACAPGAGGAATLFPGTLPSAALGELALRYGWRGPATCLSIGGGSVDGDGDADRDDDGDGDGDDRDGDGTSDGAAALHEAARLLDDGEASHVVAGAFEVLEVAGVTGVAPAVSAVIALLATTRSHAAPAADRVPAAAPLADGGAPAWAPIPWCVLREARDPFALLAASLAAPVAGGAPAQPLAPAPWPARAQGPDAPSP
ncbi:MAG TPA: hypothetical protein VK824_07020, partial [Planctomycetota bacterium]|nr:hypothetical protein [Planctomycetota bacterium]